MKSDNINQSVAQIQDSLGKLDSARAQVEKVTESGNELTKATHKLALDVKNIAEVIKHETSSVIIDFSQGLQDLDNKIDRSINKGENSITVEVDKFKKTTKVLESFTDKAINEAKLLSVETIKKQELEIEKTMNIMVANFSDKLVQFENTVEDVTKKNQANIAKDIESFNNAVGELKTTSNSVINEAKSLSVETIKKHETELARTMNTMVENFSKKLTEFDNNIGMITVKNHDVISKEIEKFKRTVIELEAISEEAISEVKSKSVETINKQAELISQTINSISKYNANIQSLIDQFSAMDLSNKLDKLNSAVFETQTQLCNMYQTLLKKQRTNSYLTWGLILLSTGIIAVICKFNFL